MMTKQPKAAAYARTNTPEKCPDLQLHVLRQYAAAHGWTDVKEHIDVGISGCTESRPAWDKLWQAILDGQVQVLVVQTIDRLSRSMSQLQQIVDALAERNIALVICEDCPGLTTITSPILLAGADQQPKPTELQVQQ